MAFGRKKTAPEQESASALGKKGKAKTAGYLSKLIQESVPEAALNQFAKNTSFGIVKDGEPRYVGLLLHADDIGGFDKKSRKDEGKGQILECISNGRIAIYATEAMLDNNSFVLIPTADTLLQCEEFSVLRDAEYTVCLIDSDGSVFPEEKKVTLRDADAVLNDDMTLDEFTGVVSDTTDAEEDYDDDDEGSAYDDPYADRSGTDDTTSVDEEDEPYDEDLDFASDAEPYDDGDGGYVGDNVSYDEAQSPEESYPEEEEEDIPDEVVQRTITRKFYSEELGLEVSLDPFDAQFLQANVVFAPFNVNRGDQWLDGYLTQMSVDANTELTTMRQNHLLRLRERYWVLMSNCCEQIQQRLDINDENTAYGKAYIALQEDHDKAVDEIDRTVSDRKAELNADWDKKIQAYVEEQAAAARRQYTDRYGRQHDDELYHVEPNVKEEVEAAYNNAKHNLFDERREDARRLLDSAITETLAELSKQYAIFMDEEQQRFTELQHGMQTFLDENRKDEVARAQALADDLEQSQRIESITSDYTQQVNALRAEYDAQNRSLQIEMDRVRKDAERRLVDKDKDCEFRLNQMQERNRQLDEQMKSLHSQYLTLDEKKDTEYQVRIKALEDRNQSQKEELEHVIEVHKHNNTISLILAIVAIIAAVAIGFIAGQWSRINYSKTVDQSAMVQEFRDQIHQAESASGQTTYVVPDTNVADGN